LLDSVSAVYNFVDSIKAKIARFINEKKFFRFTVFLIFLVLTILIVLPTWINIEQNENLLTILHHRYLELEGRVLDRIFDVD